MWGTRHPVAGPLVVSSTSRHRHQLGAIALQLAGVLSACTVEEASSAVPTATGCPRSVAEAQATSYDASTFVGTGYVIRYVPSPVFEFRGYDVHIRRSLTGAGPFMDTALLRIGSRIPGISDGLPVLMVATRTDTNRVFTPGPCVALVPIPESDVEE